MEYPLSSRPLTAREPGRVYGSWMDDPRRVLERRLNEMKIGESFEFNGYTIRRYFSGRSNSYYVRNDLRRAEFCGWAGAHLRVIDFVLGEPDKGTEEMTEYTISKRAMELLHAANKPLGVSTAGKGTLVAIKALQRQGLVEIWKDGKARTTELGREFLIGQMSAKEEERAAPTDDPITSNSRGLRGAEFDPLKLQAVDPRIEVVNQPIREPEPELSPSSNGVPPADAAPIPELPGLSGLDECNCTYRRALEYLMEQVPEIREAAEGYYALEKAVAKLRRS